MEVNRRRRRSVLGIALVAFLLATAPAAYAVSVVINDTDLTGGGGTTWDPIDDSYACTSPGAPYGFSPVANGTTTNRSDGFDEGFVVWVGGLNGKIFRDADANGNKQGQQLSVGPTGTDGLQVSQTERALQTSPTLRMIYHFRNPTSHTVRRAIALETNLGSDDETTVDGSSNGNASWDLGDRWLITHEEPFDAGADPVVTQVWYGKEARKRPTAIHHSDMASPDCFLSTFKLGFKPHQVRDLMFFAEMNDTSAVSALQKTGKFNQTHLNADLLTGLGPKARHRIVNWDL
jgi:hypothetical protein